MTVDSYMDHFTSRCRANHPLERRRIAQTSLTSRRIINWESVFRPYPLPWSVITSFKLSLSQLMSTYRTVDGTCYIPQGLKSKAINFIQ